MPCYAPAGRPSGRWIAEMFRRARDSYRVPEQPAPAILGLSIHSGSRTILPTADHPGRSGAVGTLQF